MRSREEIEDLIFNTDSTRPERLTIELLLDIRQILIELDLSLQAKEK